MNTIALLELPYSEIAALIGIVATVWGAMSGLLVLWLGTKFVNKRAYYIDRNEATRHASSQADRTTALEQANALAKEPIITMQKAVEGMQKDLKDLTDIIGKMKESVGSAIHDIDKRTVALESKASRRSAGGGR